MTWNSEQQAGAGYGTAPGFGAPADHALPPVPEAPAPTPPPVELGLDGKPFVSWDPRRTAGPRNAAMPNIPLSNWGNDPADPLATARHTPYEPSGLPGQALRESGVSATGAGPGVDPWAGREWKPEAGSFRTSEHNDHAHYSLGAGLLSLLLLALILLFNLGYIIFAVGSLLAGYGVVYGVRSHNAGVHGLATNGRLGLLGLVVSGLAAIAYASILALMLFAIGLIASTMA